MYWLMGRTYLSKGERIGIVESISKPHISELFLPVTLFIEPLQCRIGRTGERLSRVSHIWMASRAVGIIGKGSYGRTP